MGCSVFAPNAGAAPPKARLSMTVLLRDVMHLSGQGRGYDAIDEMKKRLEAVCPETSLCLEHDIPWLWAICRVFNKGNGEPRATFSRKDSQSGRADPSIEKHLNSRISTSVQNEFVRACACACACSVALRACRHKVLSRLSRKSDWPYTTVLSRDVMHLSCRGRHFT
ncbi:hypothetical protein SUGI_0977470 [Cryptomeria japonica]|nr:hypothetical protein SUGI_0977470 [Cryptomeria japonica]